MKTSFSCSVEVQKKLYFLFFLVMKSFFFTFTYKTVVSVFMLCVSGCLSERTYKNEYV